MFIYVSYKDAPELSIRRVSIESIDTSVEKSLLVNPNCPVRIMLEYIRKKCRLGSLTQFDLCDESGALMGLFSYNTYAYATDYFEHKKIYYVIVLKMEQENRYSVLPQVNQENRLYLELKAKVQKFLTSGDSSSAALAVKSTITSPVAQSKVSPVKLGSTSTKGSVKNK